MNSYEVPELRRLPCHGSELHSQAEWQSRGRGPCNPTVNEDFAGRAPDLGALETGKPVPHYGPPGLTGSRSTISNPT